MITRTSRLLLSVVNLIGFLAVVMVNVLANSVPLGGKTTGELSDQYSNLFVPAGITFAIWGLIYLALAVFVVYGVVCSLRRDAPESTLVERIGWLFLITCLANAGWIFAWQYQVLPLSLVAMLVLLVTLIALYLRLEIGTSHAAAGERFMVHLPFSIYLGWITIATIANVTALLVAYRWNGFGVSGQAWAVIMIAAGIVLTALMLFRRGDIFYGLVVDWALLGIYLKRSADASPASQTVAIAAICGMILVTAAIVAQAARRRVYA